jgi:hypothetical protein
MLKKILFVASAFVILLLLVPGQTLAQKAPGKTAPAPLNARALGRLEGVLNFCSKVNPESADKYGDMSKELTKGQTAEVVAEMRNTQEYKDSVDEMTKNLSALSNKEALATCKAQAK